MQCLLRTRLSLISSYPFCSWTRFPHPDFHGPLSLIRTTHYERVWSWTFFGIIKTNICFFNGGFTFSIFILWFWLFCAFCALISVGVIWFVIWWASGFFLWFDFGWILAVVVVVIWFWLGFDSGVWLEVMSLISSGHRGLEGELGGQPWSTVWRGLR